MKPIPIYRAAHLVLLLFALLLLSVPAMTAAAQSAQEQTKELWFRTRLNRDSLSWFGGVARPIDIASVDARNLGLLDQITGPRKQALFASAAEAEQLVPSLAGKITDLCYDLEHWAQTPAEEQLDPVAAVKRMRALADKYGLHLMIGPDRRFTEQYGAQMAPYVDSYLLQAQRLQADSTSLVAYVSPLIQEIRAANPKVQIVVQLRADGTAADVMDLIRALAPDIDGVSLLTNAQTSSVAADVVRQLGEGVAVAAAAPAAEGQPPAAPTLLPPASATAALARPGMPGVMPSATAGQPGVVPTLGPIAAAPVLPALPTAVPPAASATPEALPPAGHRSSPIGGIVAAALAGAALGAGGLAAYLRFRGGAHVQ